MSGGVIIIRRNAIKAALTDPFVSGTVPDAKQDRMQQVLQSECEDWTREDEHFLIRCLADAVDAD